MRQFYLKSFGCKVNQYDGQSLREHLIRTGYEEIPEPEGADLLAVNFCVVTGRAASRGFRALKQLARRCPGAQILVSGCLSPEDKDRLSAAFPKIKFHGMAAKGADPDSKLVDSDLDDPFGFGQVQGLEGHTRAFLKVQDGCNMRCAYCIIPSIRGAERSRPPDAVLEEAGRLLNAGYREIVLCGIRLGGYRFDTIRLDGLLARLLAAFDGDYRLRLSSLNPAEVTPPLLEVMAGDERIARHLHLPLQSGDPETLKKMRRPYSPGTYLDKVIAIREALNEPALSTDLMVGFPGESDAAFERSLDLLESARVSRVHVFPFSPRAGTQAADLKPVPDRIKTERVRIAQARAARLKEAYDIAFLGQEHVILLESLEDRATALPAGLTSRYQKTVVLGLDRHLGAGDFVRVKLKSHRDGLFTSRPVVHEPDETGGCP